MFTRNAAIVVGAVLATWLAVIGGNMAGKMTGKSDALRRAAARIPPREAGPLGPPPPVAQQPKVDTFQANPFVGRSWDGKLIPADPEFGRKVEELEAAERPFEIIRDLSFLLAKAIPLLAVFLLWRRWRNRQQSNIGNVLEGASHEWKTDPRCGVRDGAEDFQDGQELPDGERTEGSVSGVFRHLQGGAGEIRGAGGQDAETAEALPELTTLPGGKEEMP